MTSFSYSASKVRTDQIKPHQVRFAGIGWNGMQDNRKGTLINTKQLSHTKDKNNCVLLPMGVGTLIDGNHPQEFSSYSFQYYNIKFCPPI